MSGQRMAPVTGLMDGLTPTIYVFFRLHLRFVTAVTRLLPSQTRRILEYVTLANAFCLLLSLTWLHAHFVSPKGQGTTDSCLSVALARAGVDPTRLHVLQIYIRTPPESSGEHGSKDVFTSEHHREHVEERKRSTMVSGAGPTMPPDPGGDTPRGESNCDFASGWSSVTSGDAILPSETKAPCAKQQPCSEGALTPMGPVALVMESRVADESDFEEVITAGERTGESLESDGHGAQCDGTREERFPTSGSSAYDTPLEKRLSEVERLVVTGSTDVGCPIASLRCAESIGLERGSDTSEGSDISPGVSTKGYTNDGGLRSEEIGARGATEEEGNGVPDEVYLYSLEKGFLMLRPDVRQKHGVVTANVTIDAHDPCFGGIVLQALVRDFVGYDTVVMNWLISLYGGKGFLYGVRNNELFNLNYAAEFIESTEDVWKFLVFKVGVLFTTLFLFFTTTTLVSFTLRETQERMLKFTFLLQHHVRHRLPYAPLIFTHVVESLVFVPIMVGILFFLFEFFSDQLLAFMVLSVVWLCEVYSVVSVRTAMCIRFFPQMFFLYFTLFHVYFFSFPFGFSYLALVTTVLFLQHAMLFFWNRYEVPALRAGVVSASRPRQAGMIIGVVPRYDPHGMVLPLPTIEQTEGRPRAASLSSENFESLRSLEAVRRVIVRSNSSPSPGSPQLARETRVERTAGTNADVFSSAARSMRPSTASEDTQRSDDSEIAVRRHRIVEPLMRGWDAPNNGSLHTEDRAVGGSNNPPGGGSLDAGIARNSSAPLLGSFSFSLWNLMQIPSAAQTASPIQASTRRNRWRVSERGVIPARDAEVADDGLVSRRGGAIQEISHGGVGQRVEHRNSTSSNAFTRPTGSAGEVVVTDHSDRSSDWVSSVTARTRPPRLDTIMPDSSAGLADPNQRLSMLQGCRVLDSHTESTRGVVNRETNDESSACYPTDAEDGKHADEGSALRQTRRVSGGSKDTPVGSVGRQAPLQGRESCPRDDRHRRMGAGGVLSYALDGSEQLDAARRLSVRTSPTRR